MEEENELDEEMFVINRDKTEPKPKEKVYQP